MEKEFKQSTGKIRMTQNLKNSLLAIFEGNDKMGMGIYEFGGMMDERPLSVQVSKKVLIGFIDKDFNITFTNLNNLAVDYMPTIYLDGVFTNVSEKLSGLVGIKIALGMYSDKYVDESNPVIEMDSVFTFNTDLPSTIFIDDAMAEAFPPTSVEVKVINESGYDLPKYETDGAAGMDVYAAIKEAITLSPGARTLVSTGLKLEIPKGWEVDVRPKSGIALKKGIAVLNAPGLIDEDYRGTVGVILINHGTEDAVINPGDRIAQITITRAVKIKWRETSNLSDTERGAGGFGSTGE